MEFEYIPRRVNIKKISRRVRVKVNKRLNSQLVRLQLARMQDVNVALEKANKKLKKESSKKDKWWKLWS